MRITRTLTCLDRRSGDEFKYRVAIQAIGVNPSQEQARDVRLGSADQLARFIAETIFQRIDGLEHVEDRGYDVEAVSLDEVRIQVAPGMELMAAWRRGLRGRGWVPLPPELLAKRCCVNPQSGADPRCFAFAILAYFHSLQETEFLEEMRRYVDRPVGRPKRGAPRPPLKDLGLNFDGLDRSQGIDSDQITQFELQNYPKIGVFGVTPLPIQSGGLTGRLWSPKARGKPF